VSFCLIKWADFVAGVLCGRDQKEEIKEAPDRQTVEQIAFVAVGVFVLANALGTLPPAIFRILAQPGSDWMSLAHSGGELIGLGVQLVLGAYLVLGSRGLARVIDNLRRA
jgi:hypothetical protein